MQQKSRQETAEAVKEIRNLVSEKLGRKANKGVVEELSREMLTLRAEMPA